MGGVPPQCGSLLSVTASVLSASAGTVIVAHSSHCDAAQLILAGRGAVRHVPPPVCQHLALRWLQALECRNPEEKQQYVKKGLKVAETDSARVKLVRQFILQLDLCDRSRRLSCTRSSFWHHGLEITITLKAGSDITLVYALVSSPVLRVNVRLGMRRRRC